MKIAAILGSPRGMKGNTGLLLSEVIRSAEQTGALVSILSLSDYEVKPCRSCDTCHKTGSCPIHDDYQTFKTAMLHADGIVLASPNYISSVSAQMKALLDRSCGALHCQSMNGKYGAAVVTSGGGGSEEVERYLLRFLRSLGCWTVGGAGADAGQLADEKTRVQCLRKAADLGRVLCESIRAKVTFPPQVQEKTTFFERMKQLITGRRDDWPFEYDYWKSQGRL